MSEWSLVKLELARSANHPLGSVGRAYLLRVPLDEAGRIDEAGIAREPMRATARRFWPSQPDRSGYVMKAGSRWDFCELGNPHGMVCFASLADDAIARGLTLEVTEDDGTHQPFVVAEITPD